MEWSDLNRFGTSTSSIYILALMLLPLLRSTPSAISLQLLSVYAMHSPSRTYRPRSRVVLREIPDFGYIELRLAEYVLADLLALAAFSNPARESVFAESLAKKARR